MALAFDIQWKARLAKARKALGALSEMGGSQWGLCPGGWKKAYEGISLDFDIHWKSRIVKARKVLGTLSGVGGSQWGICPGGWKRAIHRNVGCRIRVEGPKRTGSENSASCNTKLSGRQQGLCKERRRVR